MEKEPKINEKLNEITDNLPNLNDLSPIFNSILKIQMPNDLIDTIINISDLMDPMVQSMMSIIKSSWFNNFSKILNQIRKLIPTELMDRFSKDLRDLKNDYMPKLIKSFTIFKQNFYIHSNSKTKQLIIYSEYLLFLSSLFENYIKKMIYIIKDKSLDYEWEDMSRGDLKSEMKKFFDLASIGFFKLFGKLYNIVDNLKHEDQKFYKRYDNFTKKMILEEALDFYLELKLFFKKSIESFFLIKIIEIRLNKKKIVISPS